MMNIPISRRLAIGLMGGATGAWAQTRPASVGVTVLSTMLSSTFSGEWGFAALVEAGGDPILFDTGNRPDTVLNNAREMKVDLSRSPSVVLTHHHRDHTGGLISLRRDVMARNPKALGTAYVGKGILLPRQPANDFIVMRGEYESAGGKIIELDVPREISSKVWLTGPIARVHDERNWPSGRMIRTAQGTVEDTLPEDQSMVIDAVQGLIVITGCGHAGIVNIVTAAQKLAPGRPVHSVIGGFHLFDADDKKLSWVAAQLKPLNIQYVLAAHCTGVESTFRLRELLGMPANRMTIAQVGMRFDAEKGISGGRG